MLINVVTVSSGWILQKMAERVVSSSKGCGHQFGLSHSPRNDVDVNVYFDVGNCYRGKTKALDIGWFSHVHADDISTVDPVCFTIDFMFHQSQKYMDMFSSRYPIERMKTAQPCEATDDFKLKKPILGVFQRGIHEGKGFYFLLNLADNKLLTNFKFLFVGSGWDEVANKMKKNNILCECRIDEDYSSYPILYDAIDYLLIPSLWEGGPMSVIEAKAKGIPIISTDVGWIGTEFPVEYLYPANDSVKLLEILEIILKQAIERRECALIYSYKKFVDELLNQINVLKGE